MWFVTDASLAPYPDMIATLSETSGGPFLPRLRDQMLSTDSGRRLLIEQPSINSKTIDMAYLRTLAPGTFGRKYVEWLDWCRVTPDTRAKVSVGLDEQTV